MNAAERDVLARVNTARAEAGCDALTGDARLAAAAGAHASDMVRTKYFAHTSPSGGTPSTRAKAAGFPAGVGENIALGYADPKAAVAGWMKSPGHRENILDCGYTVTGIGYDPGSVLAGYSAGSWVQIFGTL